MVGHGKYGMWKCGILRSGQWDWNSVEQAVTLGYHQIVVLWQWWNAGKFCQVVVCSIWLDGRLWEKYSWVNVLHYFT